MGNVIDIMGISSKCLDAVSGGTGTFGCPFEFQLPDGVILTTKGYKHPAASAFDKAALLALAQAGTIVPILDSFNFEPIDEDDVKETSNIGVNALARKGLTTLMFTYKKGIDFEKALENLQSFGAFDVWVVDKAGNILGVNKSGDFGAFTAGLLLPKTRKWNDGSTGESKSFEIQLTQPGERKNMTWIEAGSMDLFLPTELTGVNSLTLKFADVNGAVVPSSTDTTLKVSVFASDGVTPVTGLATADFDTDATGGATVVDDGNGYYTLTISSLAAGDLYVRLYDSTALKATIIKSDLLFNGRVDVTVV